MNIDIFFNQIPTFNDCLRIKSDLVTLCGDLHSPDINIDMWKKLKMVSKKIGSKTLIIAGDFSTQDCFSKYFTYDGRGLKFEIKALKLIFEDALEIFDKIYLIAGNHDLRFFDKVFGQVEMKDFFKYIHNEIGKRIILTNKNYRFCYLNDKWKIIHPKNYSRISTRVSEQIAVKEQKHIASGHGHHQGWRFDPSAKLLCCDIGCLCDARKMYYTASVDATNPNWNYGFMTIENNYPDFYNDRITDWSKYR